MTEKKPENDNNPAVKASADKGSAKGTAATTASKKRATPSSARKGSTTRADDEKAGGSHWGIALLALLVASASGGGAFYSWQQQEKSRQQQQLTIELLGKDLQRLTGQLGEQRDQLSGADQQLRRDVSERQQQLAGDFSVVTDALERLRTQIGRDQESWRIAEVEYLLQLANQRLQLAGDHATAIRALESADNRLADLADPGLLPVREQLVAELQLLRSYAGFDRERIALELGAVIQSIPSLPLQRQQHRPSVGSGDIPAAEKPGIPTSSDEWRRAGEEMWGALKGLVTIRHNGETAKPLLSPDQLQFLRLNLQLKLESARLALLDQNPDLYRATLSEAVEWLDGYFNIEQEEVAASRNTLQRLAILDIAPPRPDISGSLRNLRQLQAEAEKRGATQ